jgi:chromosome segregation ATPase
VSETALNRITGTLQAAAVSSEGRELLARGRLTGDLEATGFELLAPPTEGTQKPPRQKTTRKRNGQQARERLQTARERLRAARETAKEAEKDLRAAERAADKARRDLAQAEERADKARADAAAARKAMENAEKQLREAEGKARRKPR